jgi:hypothetical protein
MSPIDQFRWLRVEDVEFHDWGFVKCHGCQDVLFDIELWINMGRLK